MLLINTQTDSFQAGYDANGDLTQLVRAADGKRAASYDYDPFGNITQESGAFAEINPFRFSTKYTDLESNLIYYGYRYYNPQTGRWLSRDPIGEAGGENLYGFAGNNSVDLSDTLGLWVRGNRNWYGYRRYYRNTEVIAERGDTLLKLAYLITGNTSDWKYLNLSSINVKPGQIVDVAPLLVLLENRLRGNIIKHLNDFQANRFVVNYSANESSSIINQYFKPNGLSADCNDAVGIVYAKALLDILKRGEFDDMGFGFRRDRLPIFRYTYKDNTIDFFYGDSGFIRNYPDYLLYRPTGNWSGENVIALPLVQGQEAKYWGWGGFKGGMIGTYKYFENELKKNYTLDIPQKPFPDKPFPGWVNKVEFLDVAIIGQRVFDYRNKK